jgi:hypothetical protein
MTQPQIYSATFGPDTSKHWSTDTRYNRIFIEMQQNYFNDLLRARGHVFLNEVHDALGLPRTSEGQLVGWLRRDNSVIEFGMFENADGSIFLDFNVDDGVIYENI